jgi:hypothetical protein
MSLALAEGCLEDAVQTQKRARLNTRNGRRRRNGYSRDRELHAYHAAGHLVIAWRHGIQPLSATIPAYQDMLSGKGWELRMTGTPVQCLIDAPDLLSCPLWIHLERHALGAMEIFLAGHAAVLRNEEGRNRNSVLWLTDIRADWLGAGRLARHFCGEQTASEFLDLMRRRTEARLADKKTWDAIKAVAALFQPGQRLEGAEIVKTIKSFGLARIPKNARPVVPVIRRRKRYELAFEDTGYHEAGHAVIAHLCGFNIEEVSLRPDADYAGYVRCTLPPLLTQALDGDVESFPDELRPKAESYIRHLLAGRMASERHMDGLLRKQMKPGAVSDRKRMFRIARVLEGSMQGARQLILRLRNEVRQMLACPPVWAAIERVAAYLPPYEIVQGELVHRCIGRTVGEFRNYSEPVDAFLEHLYSAGVCAPFPVPAHS